MALSRDQLLFWAFFGLSIADRAILLGVFAFRYVGMDDVVIWSAAIDYGRGVFHEPYFYGQDYGPMLEALVAAPFTHARIPLNILLPVVTAGLAMAPYWSFAFWYRKHGSTAAACLLLVIPVLLPCEYGLMTSTTRGFVTGIAVLAFLPWVSDLRHDRMRAALIGAVLSTACLINPNSLPFAVAFGAWFILSYGSWSRAVGLLLLGALPAVLLQAAGQFYYIMHPERLRHVLFDWRMHMHLEGIPEALSRLDSHFAWLSPVLWPYGSAIGASIVLLLVLHVRERNRAVAAGTLLAIIVILFAFAFAKTHEGTHNVFFPRSRMFLVLPLLTAWIALSSGTINRNIVRFRTALLVAGVLSVLIRSSLVKDTLRSQLANMPPEVSELPYCAVRSDAERIGDICEEQRVQLLMLLPQTTTIGKEYRAFLLPLLDDRIPPTWIPDQDRRYWVREAMRDSAMDRVLIAGPADGPPIRFLDGSAGHAIELPNNGVDRLVLVVGNKAPMDILYRRVIGQP